MSTRQTYFGKTSLIEEAKKKLGLVIKDNAITTNKIKDSAVTESKIADNAVTTSKIKDYSVTGNKIMPGSITTDKYSPNSIITEAIHDGAITEEKIRDNAVTTNKIKDGNVTGRKIADTSITQSKIADGAVITPVIANKAVTNEKLADNAVTGRNIKEGSININQLSDKCISDIQTSSMGEEAIKSFINDELSKKQGEIIEVDVRKTDDNGDLVEDDLDNPKITSFDFNTIYEKFKAGQPIIILYKYSKPVYESPRKEAIEVLTVYNMDNQSIIIYGHHSSSPGWNRTILASNDTRNILLASITKLSDSDIWRMSMTEKEKESNKNELTFSYIKNL